jgi:hypothetical protein
MPANILTGLSAKQLRRAATLRERIDGLEKQLATLLGAPAPAAPAAKPAGKPKRKMTAAARAKIAAAQKRRWAKHRAAKKKA